MQATISRPKLFALAATLALGAVLWTAIERAPRPPKTRAITAIAFSPDGRGIAAGTSQGAIYACDSLDLMNCRTFEADGSLNDLRFSDNGELVIADRNIRVAKLDKGLPRLIRSDGANYGAVRLGPDGRGVLTIDGNGAVMIVDLYTGHASPGYCCSSIWGSVEFLDQGHRAIWAGHWPGIWDFSSAKLVGRLTAQREVMTFGPIAMDAQNGLVYMGSQDGHVYQWDLESRELLSKSVPLSGYVMTISVLDKSGWIAYASQPGVIHLWNPQTRSTRIVHAARASSNVVFNPHRGLAAFGTASGTIEFWDLPQERLVEAKAFSSFR